MLNSPQSLSIWGFGSRSSIGFRAVLLWQAPGMSPFDCAVIIAAHNVEGWLEEAVLSAASQTLPPSRIIVVENGSTDRTRDVLARLEPYCRALYLDAAGKSAALNHAIQQLDNDWIVILDGDDWWDRSRLEALGQLAARRPDCSILTTDAWVYYERGRRTSWRWFESFPFYAGADQDREILRRNFVFGSAAVRTDLVRDARFDVDLMTSQDYDMWLRLIRDGHRAAASPQPLAYYRRHSSNRTRSSERVLLSRLRILGKALSGADDECTAIIRRRMDMTERQLRVLSARTAVLEREAGSRRAALDVARSRDIGTKHRVSSALAAVSPRGARWWWLRTNRDEG
jgi:GT2 family glycosyltransferase